MFNSIDCISFIQLKYLTMAMTMAISSQTKWDEEIKRNDTRWGEMNNNVNEEYLKCQLKAEHEYDSLFSDTVEVNPGN